MHPPVCNSSSSSSRPSMLRPAAMRSRRDATTRSSAALVALLALCLCEVGSVLVAKESAAVQQPGAGVKSMLSPANVQPHQTWQQHPEKERSAPRSVRRSQSAGWIQSEENDDHPYVPHSKASSSQPSSSSSSSSATWIEPLLRQQWEPMSSSDEPEEMTAAGLNDVMTSEAVAVAKPVSWRDNELVAPSSVDQVDGSKSGVQQLNWHEAQLARLHGLGPAEIAALSTWQHKLRLHPLPNRLIATTGWQHQHHQPPSFSPRNLLPLNGGSHGPKSSLHSQQVLTPFDDDADVPPGKLGGNGGNGGNGGGGHHPLNRLQYVQQSNQTQPDESQDNLLLLPLWPKRSTSDMKKSDRENNRNRNGANNRKEKSEAANAGQVPGGKGNKAKGSRKQQQQQHSQDSSSSHRPFSGAAAGASVLDGAALQQHEHNGRPSGGSSPTPDVNRMNRNLATQFLLRSPRENRQYDVPIIGKPIINN